MNRLRLRIYLNDHLAACAAGIARTQASIKANRSSGLAPVLEDYLNEVMEARRALIAVMERLKLRRTRLKELAALGMERLGRFKLNGRLVRYSPLSRLEEIEFLSGGASLRIKLWEALLILSRNEPQFDAHELESLERRAREQEATLSALHKEWVCEAFGMGSGGHLN